jgi:hypothetical protein
MREVVKVQDYIRTIEAWPITGSMELDYTLVARIHAFIMDPLVAMHFKVRAFNKFRQVVDRPVLACQKDVQAYIHNHDQ